MGGAILAGLRSPDVDIHRPIAVTTKSAASAAAFAGADDVVAFSGEHDADANRKAVAGAQIVVLGVKPWMVIEVAREIAPEITAGTIVVSVVAGVPAEKIEAELPGARVVRAMPNTPSHLGRGVTGVAGGSTSDDEAIDTVRRLFETVGDVVVVEERQIADIAAVSGSGPAYLFYYVEQMTAAAERLGFTPSQARTLVNGTVSGAAELLVQSGEDPAELRRKVTSPKGTTEQAVFVLQDAEWGDLFDRALAANVRRSEEIARGE